MGLLDSVLGGLGDDAAGGLGDLLKGQGGVGGMVDALQKGGLGDVAASWIGKGENLSVSPEQIEAVLGSGPVADFAQKLGISPEQAAETISGLLPEAIDRLTPNGKLEDLVSGGVGDLIGGLFKR